MSPTNRLYHFHQQYIANTDYRARVFDNAFYVGSISLDLAQKLKLSASIVIINSRSLKHLYDKRTAHVYDFLLQHLHEIINQPDMILESVHTKHGFAFAKHYGDNTY